MNQNTPKLLFCACAFAACAILAGCGTLVKGVRAVDELCEGGWESIQGTATAISCTGLAIPLPIEGEDCRNAVESICKHVDFELEVNDDAADDIPQDVEEVETSSDIQGRGARFLMRKLGGKYGEDKV